MVGTVGPLIITFFALTGGYYLFRLIRDPGWNDRILDATHLLMSVLMMTMPLGWSTRIPAGLQIVLFTAAALWYAYLLMFRPYAVSETVGSHHAGRPRLLYHVGMMLAMVWMAAIMAPLPGSAASASTMPDASMEGMIMPGMGPAHGASGAVVAPVHGWAHPVSVMLGIAFGLATVWYVVRFVITGGAAGRPDGRKLADNGAAALMAAGMALGNLLVLS